MLKVFVAEGPAVAFGPGNFYRRLVEVASGHEVRIVGNSKQADLIVGSYSARLSRAFAEGVDRRISRRQGRHVEPFSRFRERLRRSRPTSAPSLWFTTENVRPPLNEWDLTLSFDLESIGASNVYCPLWWGEISLLPDVGTISVDRLGEAMNARRLTLPRSLSGATGQRFVCAFINNPEPMRLHAIKLLERIGQVDVYGRLSGRSVRHKADVAHDYRYMLCFENDVYPGYVTEKPFEAWCAGTVPIWRGSDPMGFLNKEAIINASLAGGLDAMVAEVIRLERDPAAYERTFSAPLLTSVPDLTPVLGSIRALVA